MITIVFFLIDWGNVGAFRLIAVVSLAITRCCLGKGFECLRFGCVLY